MWRFIEGDFARNEISFLQSHFVFRLAEKVISSGSLHLNDNTEWAIFGGFAPTNSLRVNVWLVEVRLLER